MIEARELSRSYGPIVAVDRVSFSAESGSVVGLLGPNGAGKTTIMKVLTGYHYPHGGTATIEGFDVVSESLESRRRVGYLPETTPVYSELTVLEYLEFIAQARGIRGNAARAAFDRVVELCAIESVRARPIGELSKGFRQRVGLAQALIHDPPVLILDEPTSGLDPNQIQEIRRLIGMLREDHTVLLSTHILSEVEAVCDRVLIVDRGRIVASGTPREIAREMRSSSVVTLELTSTLSGQARSGLDRIGETLSVEAADPGVRVRVALRPGEPSEALFDWAVEHGLRLRSLEPERFSLEEIFTRLTGGSA